MTLDRQLNFLIADDHLPIRVGLQALVEMQPNWKVIGLAADGDEALSIARQHAPDVAILDMRMPKMDGIQATLAILSELPTTKIMILSTYDEDEEIFRALQAGAHAYLLKGFRREELIEGVQMILSGERYLPTRVASKLADRMSRPSLTQRELDTLNLVATGRSNREIAKSLFISEETVKTHLRTLYQKLNVSDRTQAVTAALKHGLVKLQ
jgi:two-component system, NarL family, response regulator